jgi:hypothetical protein
MELATVFGLWGGGLAVRDLRPATGPLEIARRSAAAWLDAGAQPSAAAVQGAVGRRAAPLYQQR